MSDVASPDAEGLTDDLFPIDEALRFYNRTKHNYPGATVGLLFADIGHPRAPLAGEFSQGREEDKEMGFQLVDHQRLHARRTRQRRQRRIGPDAGEIGVAVRIARDLRQGGRGHQSDGERSQSGLQLPHGIPPVGWRASGRRARCLTV